MRFLSWAKCLTCTVLLCAFMKYQEADGNKTTPHPKDCIYNDSDGNICNLTTIRYSNGNARFETSGIPGYPDQKFKYSFNPCISFTLGLPGGLCQSDVAICMWYGMDYIRIGTQSSVQFGFYMQTKIPALSYTNFPWKSTVLLKCDLNEEEGTFMVRGDPYAPFLYKVFQLTHKCACPNACLIGPSELTTKEPTPASRSSELPTKEPTANSRPSELPTMEPTATSSDPTDNILLNRVVLVVAEGVSFMIAIGLVGIFRKNLIDFYRRVFRRQPNDEQRAILGENGGAVVDTQYNIPPCTSEGSGSTSGRGSSCSYIKVPNNKDNLNSKNRM